MSDVTWFCQWCWSEITPDAKSCPACGKSLTERLPYSEALELALRSIDGLTARRAAYMLGARRDWHAIPALARAVDEGDPYLAAEAVRALGQIGTPEALALVKVATLHRWLSVRTAAEEIVAREGKHVAGH